MTDTDRTDELVRRLDLTGTTRLNATPTDDPANYMHVYARLSKEDGKLMHEARDHLSSLTAERDQALAAIIAEPAECAASCEDSMCPYTHQPVTWRDRAEALTAENKRLREERDEAERAMAKVRCLSRNVEGDALLWQLNCAEERPSGLLLRVWRQRRDANKRAEALTAENKRLREDVEYERTQFRQASNNEAKAHADYQHLSEKFNRVYEDFEAAEARLAEALEVVRPFAAIAEHDIGESESDDDLFRSMRRENARAPLLTVGHLRRARAFLSTHGVSNGR